MGTGCNGNTLDASRGALGNGNESLGNITQNYEGTGIATQDEIALGFFPAKIQASCPSCSAPGNI